MSQEHKHGNFLAEPMTIEGGKVLTTTEAPDEGVHIHFGNFGTTFPRFIIENDGNGDFSLGLVKTVRGLAKTFREIGLI